MNVKEFMESYGLKNGKTVLGWLEGGLVPGAQKKDGEWDIPSLAMPPYTKCRAKTATAIYVSIIEACNSNRSVCAKLYHISDEIFRVYIENLEKEELITVREENGAAFYFATPKSMEYVNDRKGLERLIKKLSPLILPVVQALMNAAAQAAVTAAAGA